MRLTCPNCDAQYEVPEDVIPADGRDVQCSNCSNTWFQAHASAEPTDADTDDFDTDVTWTPEVDDAPLENGEDDTSDAGAPDAEADPEEGAQDAAAPSDKTPESAENDAALAAAVKAAVQRARADREGAPVSLDLDAEEPPAEVMPEPPAPDHASQLPDFEAQLEADIDAMDAAEPAATQTPEAAAEPSTAPKRRELDPAIADVLREEAALEAARRAEDGNLESQPELGLDPPDPDAETRARQARERMARMRGVSVEEMEKPAAPIPANSRRDLLPDIEEINSTLRATEDRSVLEQPDGRPTPTQMRARGGRLGFALALLIVAVAIVVYTQPQTVVDMLPQSESYVISYIEAVNKARLALDAKVTDLMLWLDSMAPQTDAAES
ncbi:zinc-ribbon domain-containing protein [Cognatishimia sp. SS12]|uniref:zinc-ribbon domain-containing protein n=1 Tax=Cognatishimia sp. SS12 TaxID=2979465 RepID=UPI00232FDC58|nr:zinc-ribbon domain-containing protein [Cognatishimia sp. SS12]MDC0739065.1 zinc-ribbon domain-containing protein [Cognatishimia sp. SS12]